MNMSGLGLFLIFAGAVLALAGLALYLGGNLGVIGRLPGDIRIERGNFRLYFPITTSILASAALTLGLMLLSRLR